MRRALLIGFTICTLMFLAAHANATDQDPWKQRVGLHLADTPLKTALEDLCKQTGLSYAFEQGADDALAETKVTINVSSTPVESALDKLLTSVRGKYHREGTVIVISIDVEAQLKKPIDLEVTNAQLDSVLRQLFQSAGIHYTAYGNVEMLTVSALKLKNVPFETALTTLLKAAGATYEREGDAFVITNSRSPYGSLPLGYGTTGESSAQNRKTVQYILKHVDPEFVVDAVRGVPGISGVQAPTQSVGAGKILHFLHITGTPDAIKRAVEVAKSIDVPWPTRAVEISIQAKGTYQVKGKLPVVNLSNPSISTPDGREATIEITSTIPNTSAGQPTGESKIGVTVLPKVQPDGRVWLKGSVDSKWLICVDKGTPKEVSFAKIQIDSILEPGKPQSVMSAVTDLGQDNTAGLEITATAKVVELKAQNSAASGKPTR